jgi:hypothetical protein
MRYIALTLLLSLLLAAIILPWMEAYRSDKMTGFHCGEINGKSIQCFAVDGTHFDRYSCLVFSDKNKSRVTYREGRILLDGKPIDFPKGCNVGWLQANGQIEFETLTQEDIDTRTSGGNSEIYYIFGKLPKLKKWRFGLPRIELVERKAESL